ncbi:MAG: mechanosensitive ion channel [Pirellulales bacterium]|nr:mechanosensitive ion channel [Pirellulales bacterium]
MRRSGTAAQAPLNSTFEKRLTHGETFVLLAALLVGWLVPATALGQTYVGGVPLLARQPAPPGEPGTTSTAVPVTVEALEARLRDVETDTALDEKAKVFLTEHYRAALDDRKRAADLNARRESLARQLSEVPDRSKVVADELAKPVTEPNLVVPSNAAVGELQQLAAEQVTRRKQLADEKKELDAEPQRRIDRKLDISRTRETSQDQLSEVRRRLTAIGGRTDLPPELSLADQAALLAREQLLVAQLALWELEEQFFSSTIELLEQEQKLAARRLSAAQALVDAWQEKLQLARVKEARGQAMSASTAAARVRDDATKALAEENKALAALRIQLPEQIRALQQKVDSLDHSLKELKSRAERDRGKVDDAGLTEPIRSLLSRRRRELERDRIDLERDLLHGQTRAPLWRKLVAAQEQLFALEDQAEALDELDDAVDELLQSPAFAANTTPREELRNNVRTLLANQSTILTSLIPDYREYYEALIDVDTKQQLLREQQAEYSDWIDGLMLWIRSTEVAHAGTLQDAVACLSKLRDPQDWKAAAEVAEGVLRIHPLSAGLGVLVMFAVVLARDKLRKRMRQQGEIAARRNCAVFGPTLESLAATIISAAMWPGFCWFIAWLLVAKETGALGAALSSAFATTAQVMLLGEFLCQVCRPLGLAEAHFQWPARGVSIVRRNLRAAMFVGLPFLLITVTIHSSTQTDEVWRHSLGRLLFIAGMLLVAFFVHRILRPSSGALADYITLYPQGWASRLRPLWYAAAMAAPLSLALLSAAGYHYTADQLAWRMFVTLAILTGAVVVHALLLRWLLITRRRLAMQQARERRAAMVEARQDVVTAEGDTAGAIVLEEPMIDLSTIDEQTRKLINVLVCVLLGVGCYLAWVDVLPALGVLNQITLWSSDTAINLGVNQLGMPVQDITLAHLLLSLVAVALTYVAGKNIPGLLEIAVLQRLPLTASARYAVSTVCRYLIVVIGAMIAFGLVGIGWSKVQWLVAAMTVGLGFGLQEIFANFVSGLIILFEQPVRLGDVITVGNMSGTVTRIRMRATTITNGDRQELIVPNKDFITGRVVNWTLSDTIQRLQVNVGVAYGSDVSLVRDLLQRAAREHTLVLKDPEPKATFESFGDSTMNFALQAFVPGLEVVSAARHDILSSIDRLFREAEIEIAYPQRDLRIRSIATPVAIVDERCAS